MSGCAAWTIPGYYTPESKRCSRKILPRTFVEFDGKKKKSCTVHVREYMKKGAEIFSPRLPREPRIK